MWPMFKKIGPNIGLEFDIMGDVNNKNNDFYYGVTYIEGIGYGKGGEAHIEWGETNSLHDVNVFIFISYK